MGTYDGKTGGVGGGAMVDLLHEGTVLRESESEIIDQLEATVRSDKNLWRVVVHISLSKNYLPKINTVDQGGILI